MMDGQGKVREDRRERHVTTIEARRYRHEDLTSYFMMLKDLLSHLVARMNESKKGVKR
jgi:hypothetical protein